MTNDSASNRMDGKVAVVTGGGSGIGLAIARRFVEAGAHVFITGRRETELQKASDAIGRNVTAVPGDVTKSADLEQLFARVKGERGRIDALVCNAGGGSFAPLGTLTPQAFHDVFILNTPASCSPCRPLCRYSPKEPQS